MSTNIAFMEGTASVLILLVKFLHMFLLERMDKYWSIHEITVNISDIVNLVYSVGFTTTAVYLSCLLYTSPSPRD